MRQQTTTDRVRPTVERIALVGLLHVVVSGLPPLVVALLGHRDLEFGVRLLNYSSSVVLLAFFWIVTVAENASFLTASTYVLRVGLMVTLAFYQVVRRKWQFLLYSGLLTAINLAAAHYFTLAQ